MKQADTALILSQEKSLLPDWALRGPPLRQFKSMCAAASKRVQCAPSRGRETGFAAFLGRV